jgi:hypothetical protein
MHKQIVTLAPAYDRPALPVPPHRPRCLAWCGPSAEPPVTATRGSRL